MEEREENKEKSEHGVRTRNRNHTFSSAYRKPFALEVFFVDLFGEKKKFTILHGHALAENTMNTLFVQ